MAKHSKSKEESSEESLSISSEEEQVNDQANEVVEEEDEEELEAVARPVDSDDDDDTGSGDEQDDEDNNNEDEANNEISSHEKARLKEMQKLKRQKVQEILDQQNATIDADMNNGKGRLKFLLQQPELFAHFAKSDQSASQKKGKGSLKEEEDGLSGTGHTRLLVQPSCILER